MAGYIGDLECGGEVKSKDKVFYTMVLTILLAMLLGIAFKAGKISGMRETRQALTSK